MATRSPGNFIANKYILPAFLLLAVYVGVVEAGRREPDIYPGDKIAGVVSLGSDIEQAITQLELSYEDANIKRHTNQSGGVIETGMGITLVYDTTNKIRQIITVDPALFTPRRIHVFSHLDDVLRSYGDSFRMIVVKDGYYLTYQELGIGFDVESETKRVRSIVIYAKQAASG